MKAAEVIYGLKASKGCFRLSTWCDDLTSMILNETGDAALFRKTKKGNNRALVQRTTAMPSTIFRCVSCNVRPQPHGFAFLCSD